MLPILGGGGFGAVYKFKDNLALKVPTSEAYARSIYREVSFMKRIDSKFILRLVHSFDLRRGFPVLLSELCPMDLDILREYWETFLDEVPLQMVKYVATCVCMAIGHLHQRSVAHFDIKTNNVLISVHGIPKLCDLGSVHPLNEAGESVHGVEFMNFTLYKNMTPEVLRGGAASWRADYYALGVLLFELMEGRHPLWTELPTRAEAIMKILEGTIIYTDTEHVFRDLINRLVCWLCDYYVNNFPTDMVTSPILDIAQEVLAEEQLEMGPLTANSSVRNIVDNG
ncbi:serine/threonine-protein kinase AtPK2/AtPK19-like [Lingula anatina]|uniref:Serine/threonine-protein kinase AtPK2/AtPK19-like n=1 Tax=Lingula anatina TaxID=7574 RepID=A0A1S3H683_LINAN|nr:serine/threonine-protein kinase AtPK2/AtPK19-like [Lingula anatina]|eukprot:XP_013381508.1 serine/threonine-protein kinase AtPK2/AtPK19-like [Lingula anatina]